MKAVLAYNYNVQPSNPKPDIGGGPTSAFTPYLIG